MTTTIPDRTVADAIDRVLEAEHAAALTIVAAEAAARSSIETLDAAALGDVAADALAAVAERLTTDASA